MSRLCPHCATEMHLEMVDNVYLSICPRCAGVWFNAEDLRSLLARDPMALSELEDRTISKLKSYPAGLSVRPCPDCAFPLQQSHYLYNSPILLDVCPQCGGFFVEDGELGKMQNALDESHRPMSREEEKELTIAEFAIAHDNEMRRQENLRELFGALRRYRAEGPFLSGLET